MAKGRPTKGAAEEGPPRLRIPLADAERTLDERIAMGNQLLSARNSIQSADDLKTLRNRYYTWKEYNGTWLGRNVGKAMAEEATGWIGIAVGGASSLREEIKWHDDDVDMYVRRLESVRERLPLWVDDPIESQGDVLDTAGPIFVVHGRDEATAQHVARVLERGTGREVTILHERANQGRTLIEKFEHHAQLASFAVVVLTGDDEGGLAGSGSHKPRGRQNVIFELGFFFGKLGRNRVVVLTVPQVERPSDVDGLVYLNLDSAGAWKHELARELEAAEIAVNRSKLP